MKKTILLLTILAFSLQTNAQKINWISLNEALELQKAKPKKIMMDVYTNWWVLVRCLTETLSKIKMLQTT